MVSVIYYSYRGKIDSSKASIILHRPKIFSVGFATGLTPTLIRDKLDSVVHQLLLLSQCQVVLKHTHTHTHHVKKKLTFFEIIA